MTIRSEPAANASIPFERYAVIEFDLVDLAARAPSESDSIYSAPHIATVAPSFPPKEIVVCPILFVLLSAMASIS
jgi:hypothetical protein